jgi:DNA repair exonuclease SbcCD ATPase subunit
MNNFGSFYGTHQLDLRNRGLTFVLGDNLDEPKMESNGAGKSTVFDALFWALFGTVPKGDKAQSVVNEEAGKRCWVQVELEVEKDETWLVYRYRQMPEGHGVKLFCMKGNEVTNCTMMDGKATDARIETVIGMDKDVFLAAVYRKQGDNFDFADATDSERKRILSRIVPELSECDRLQERAKEKAAEASTAYSNVIAANQAIEANLAGYKQTNVGVMEEQWRANRDQRLQQAQAQLQQAQEALQYAQSVVAVLPQKQQELASLVAPEVTWAWATERDRRLQACNAAQQPVSQANAHVEHINKRLQKLEAMQEGECSECGQPVTGQHLQNEKAKLHAELTQAQASRDQAIHGLDQADAHYREAVGYADQEKAYNDGVLASYNHQKGVLEAEIRQLQQTNLQYLQTQVDNAQYSVSQIQAEQWIAPDNATSIQVFEEQLAAGQKEAEQKLALLNHWQWWVEALSNKGIKSYILDSRIELMTDAANSWVQALTGGTTWVRFETQSMTSSGKLNEQFNIRIFRHNPDGTTTERSYRSWSGGEKKRVALGIDQGLSQLVASRASKSWGLYIIDESFRQHMDSGGREAVFELLQSMDRDSIFVVDHDKEMAGQFERQLKVRIQNRRSMFPDEPIPDYIDLKGKPLTPEMFVEMGKELMA